MAVGFALLATMGADASTTDAIRNVVIVGIGVGLMMQTLIVVVQNAAPRELLGVATASAQFSRWIGATIGVTLMGAIVASRLGHPAADRRMTDFLVLRSLRPGAIPRTGQVGVRFGF